MSDALKFSPSITSLALSTSNALDSDVYRNLFHMLLEFPSITSFKIEIPQISDIEVAHSFKEMIASHKSLRELTLCINCCGVDGWNLIFDGLAANKSLTSLSMGHNTTPRNFDAGVRQYSRLFQRSNCLKQISVDDDAHECKVVCEALKGRNNIRHLTIRNNLLGRNSRSPAPYGWKFANTYPKLVLETISEMLSTNDTLTLLDISNNQLSDDDIRLLLPGLNRNGSIKTLVLEGSSMTDEGLQNLTSALADNRTLTRVDLPPPFSHYAKDILTKQLFTQCYLNKIRQRREVEDTLVLIGNIARNEQVLPQELWLDIFSLLHFPGVDIDWSRAVEQAFINIGSSLTN